MNSDKQKDDDLSSPKKTNILPNQLIELGDNLYRPSSNNLPSGNPKNENDNNKSESEPIPFQDLLQRKLENSRPQNQKSNLQLADLSSLPEIENLSIGDENVHQIPVTGLNTPVITIKFPREGLKSPDHRDETHEVQPLDQNSRAKSKFINQEVSRVESENPQKTYRSDNEGTNLLGHSDLQKKALQTQTLQNTPSFRSQPQAKSQQSNDNLQKGVLKNPLTGDISIEDYKVDLSHDEHHGNKPDNIENAAEDMPLRFRNISATRPHKGDNDEPSIIQLESKEELYEPKKHLSKKPRSFLAVLRSISCKKDDVIGVIAFSCCLVFIIVVFGVLSSLMAFHFKYKEINLTALANPLNYIASNLDTNLIIEMQIISPGASCTPGYELLTLGHWPGTTDGCLCSNNDLKIGSCDASDDGEFCEEISDYDGGSFIAWPGSVWCVQRLQPGQDFVKSTICPTNYTGCSPGICVKDGLLCPITEVQMTTPSGPLTVTRSTAADASPLLNIVATINDIPCFDPTETPLGAEPYKLLEEKPRGCGKYGTDTEYSYQIATTSQDKILIANSFPQEILNLPLYRPVLESTTVYLAGRNRILIKSDPLCDTINSALIFDASKAGDSLNDTVRGCVMAAIIIHLIIFYVVLYVSINSDSSFIEDIVKHNEKDYWLSYLIGFGIECIIYMVMIGLVRKDYFILTDAQAQFNIWRDAQCLVGDKPNMVFNDYNTLIDDIVEPLHKYSIILLAVSLGPCLLLCLINCCRKN